MNPESSSVYLFNEGKNMKPGKLWNIKVIADKLSNDVCKRLFISHAILGCDTTSRIYGMGKSLGLKLILSQNQHYQTAADVFYNNNSNKTEIKKVEENTFVQLYGGEQEKDLDNVCYDIFQKKICFSNNFVHPKTLPSTSASAEYTSPRCYFQIQTWVGRNGLCAEDWEWVKHDGVLYPKITSSCPR
jgi:hypothetical protein